MCGEMKLVEAGAHSENVKYLKWNRIFILVKFVVIPSIPNITYSPIEKNGNQVWVYFCPKYSDILKQKVSFC